MNYGVMEAIIRPPFSLHASTATFLRNAGLLLCAL